MSQPHRHRCSVCGCVFLCEYGCLLDDDGVPLDLTDECDACIAQDSETEEYARRQEKEQ